MHSRSSAAKSGIPFVLVHGLVISSLYMIPLAECLAANHEVHALDLPGFGRSQGRRHALNMRELADAVVAWMSAHGMERCHLFANSLGCQIAAHVAVDAPGRVATLTLAGATIDSAAHRLPIQVFRLLRDAFGEPPRLWMDWIFDFCRSGVRHAIETTRAMFADYIENQLPVIKVETLVLRGERDPTMPASWARNAVQLLPHARLHELKNGPHCVHFTNPHEIAAILLNFANHVSPEP